MTNPTDVLRDLERKTAAESVQTEKIDDLGLCSQASSREDEDAAEAAIEEYKDLCYRARHSLTSAQVFAAETREKLTSALAAAMNALNELMTVEHEIEDALDWVKDAPEMKIHGTGDNGENE